MVKLFAVGVAALVGSSAMAGEGGLTIQVNHKVLTYSSSTTKTDVGGTSTDEKTTEVATYPGDLTVLLGFNNWAVYLYPGQEGRAIGAGYMVMPELEVGVNLGVNSKNIDKPKTETADNNYGIYGIYYLNMGKPSLEIGLNIDSISSNEKADETEDGVDNAVDTLKTSGMSYGLNVDYILPVAGAFSYFAGLNYSLSNTKDTTTAGTDEKVTDSSLAVTLAGARFDF